MKRGQRGRPPIIKQMEEAAQQASQAAVEGHVFPQNAQKGSAAMAKKAPGKPPTKRKLVEAYLAEHPNAPAREVVDAIFRDHGVSVTPVYVSMIRGRRRRGRGRLKRAAAAAAPQEAAPTPPKSPLERMLAAEREALVRRLEAIDTLLKGR